MGKKPDGAFGSPFETGELTEFFQDAANRIVASSGGPPPKPKVTMKDVITKKEEEMAQGTTGPAISSADKDCFREMVSAILKAPNITVERVDPDKREAEFSYKHQLLLSKSYFKLTAV